MKVTATGNGVVIALSDIDINTLMKLAHPTSHSTRQVLETMTQVWSANFYEDAKTAIDILDEQDLDREAENAAA